MLASLSLAVLHHSCRLYRKQLEEDKKLNGSVVRNTKLETMTDLFCLFEPPGGGGGGIRPTSITLQYRSCDSVAWRIEIMSKDVSFEVRS